MLSELNVQFMINKNSAAVLVGEESRIYTSDQPEFQQVKDLVAAGDELGLVKLVRGLKDFVAKLPYVGFTVRENIVFINDEAVPHLFGKRLKAFADQNAPYEYLLKFWENVKRNPSKNSVDNLFDFLDRVHCPISVDGFIQAYKTIRSDYMDKYSGTIPNKPGMTIEVARNSVDDNRDNECSHGIHVGGLTYTHWYGSQSNGDRLMLVLVDPADFVAVPTDFNYSKARVCKYEVVKEVSWDEVESTSEVYKDDVEFDEYE